MVLSISINQSTEARLRELARAAGKDVDTFVAQLVEQAAARPSLDQLLAPLRDEFLASGTTDEQLVDEIQAARDAYRAGPQNKKAG